MNTLIKRTKKRKTEYIACEMPESHRAIERSHCGQSALYHLCQHNAGHAMITHCGCRVGRVLSHVSVRDALMDEDSWCSKCVQLIERK